MLDFKQLWRNNWKEKHTFRNNYNIQLEKKYLQKGLSNFEILFLFKKKKKRKPHMSFNRIEPKKM